MDNRWVRKQLAELGTHRGLGEVGGDRQVAPKRAVRHRGLYLGDGSLERRGEERRGEAPIDLPYR